MNERLDIAPDMENVKGQWFYTDEIMAQAIREHGCNCDRCCAAISLENSIRRKTKANQPIK